MYINIVAKQFSSGMSSDGFKEYREETTNERDLQYHRDIYAHLSNLNKLYNLSLLQYFKNISNVLHPTYLIIYLFIYYLYYF